MKVPLCTIFIQINAPEHGNSRVLKMMLLLIWADIRDLCPTTNFDDIWPTFLFFSVSRSVCVCRHLPENGTFIRINVLCQIYAFSIIWAASSEFGTYRLCEQRRFKRACAFAQSRQNLRCSPIQAVSQEEPSDRKPDP